MRSLISFDIMKDPLSIPWIYADYKPVPKDVILKTISQCFDKEPRIFYLTDDVAETVKSVFHVSDPENPGGEYWVNPYENEADVLINMPFESVIMECGGGLVQLSTDVPILPRWKSSDDTLKGTINHQFGAITFRELSPGSYVGFGILMGQVEHPDDVKHMRGLSFNGNKLIFRDNYFMAAMPLIDVDDYSEFHGSFDLPFECRLFVRAFFDKLKTSYAIGKEKSSQRLRVGTGQDRRLLRVKNILHVAMKKERAAYEKKLGKEIDWTHRWEVMGHWRSVRSIGKDRTGNYTVKGFTWVNPHTKGPEEKRLIKKVRVIHEDARV